MRRAFALSTATLVAAVGLAGTASAHAVSTKITLDGFEPHYFTKRIPNAFNAVGHIESNKHKCVAGRRVDVFLNEGGPDTKIGTDKSDTNGGWSLLIPTPDFLAGDYHAQTPKRVLGNGTVCAADRSPDVANT